MNEDSDLKRMFQAQRKVDEGLAPSFDDMEARLHTARDFSTTASDRRFVLLAVPVALTAIALSTVIGLAGWINALRPIGSDVSLASQADLQKLNQVCNSLLLRIKELETETKKMTGTVAQEMDWPTGTDSLIPFELLSFSVRRSP